MRFVFWQGQSGVRRIYVRGHGLPAVIFADEAGIHIGRRWGPITVSNLAEIGAAARDFAARFRGVRGMLATLAWRSEERRARAAFEICIVGLCRLTLLLTSRGWFYLCLLVRPRERGKPVDNSTRFCG